MKRAARYLIAFLLTQCVGFWIVALAGAPYPEDGLAGWLTVQQLFALPGFLVFALAETYRA